MRNNVYVLLISIHGLIRGHDLELGCNADTGGQTKYVLDLAQSLGEQKSIEKVDLVTRFISEPSLSSDYSQPEEQLSDKARIVRIKTDTNDYIPKEQLWDHLDCFMDNLVTWLNNQSRMPDIIHSHYADAGYVGVKLSNLLSVPLIHTGHSLGRDKRKRLLAQGLSREAIETTYNIARRIDSEEEILANADLVIASTHNEIEVQYGLYDYYDPKRMIVIPPGINLEQFYPHSKKQQITFQDKITHFLKEPDKPIILALSRPDERKNLHTLIEAYGESTPLQEKANLLIIAGLRDDIHDLDKNTQTVFKNIFLLVDKYDIYGRIALPKSHSAEEVPEIYRLAASSKGVFINPALTEPFGLTILEAAACGLPVVATENGGPVDIISNCNCGTLIDPLDKNDISSALLDYLSSPGKWELASKNGVKRVREHYSWLAHSSKYLEAIRTLPERYPPTTEAKPVAKALRYRDHAIFSDLDQNLVGHPQSLILFSNAINENRKTVSFGIATGRRIDSALALMKKHSIPKPDILISSLGTRIHYGQNLTEDAFWTDHIDHDWTPRRIAKLLNNLRGLKRQPQSEQSRHKISYYYDDEVAPDLQTIVDMLRQMDITANIVPSFGQFLDIIPSRASKGQALRYVSQRLDIPLENMLVAGGSGADEDMMRGNTLAVVVANRHNEELSQLVDINRIYFASTPYASGILEAITHYNFFSQSVS